MRDNDCWLEICVIDRNTTTLSSIHVRSRRPYDNVTTSQSSLLGHVYTTFLGIDKEKPRAVPIRRLLTVYVTMRSDVMMNE